MRRAGAPKGVDMRRRDRGGSSTIQRRNVFMVDELAEVEELRVRDRLLDEGDSRPPSRTICKDEVLPNNEASHKRQRRATRAR